VESTTPGKAMMIRAAGAMKMKENFMSVCIASPMSSCCRLAQSSEIIGKRTAPIAAGKYSNRFAAGYAT